MKILQITNKVPFPEKDGGAIACMSLLKGLSLSGHDITLLAMSTLKHHITVDELPAGIRKLADFRFVDVPAPVTAVGALTNLLFSKLPYNAQRFIDPGFSKYLVSLLKEKEFDLIQLEGLYVCPYIPEIRKHTTALIAYRAHNIEFEIWERTVKLAKGAKKFYFKLLSNRIKKFEKSWLDSYDLLIPITQRDGLILDKLGNTRPKHISQTGVDTLALVPDKQNLEYPSLFHIGSLEWAPNQEGLVWFIEKCWQSIHRKHPNLKFYVAGRRAPKWLVKKLDAPNVIFLGEIDDAHTFMNTKSIMVVPLFSGSGMRIKIIEGMALGKAIVSTTIGTEGIATTMGKNILIADNQNEFVGAISRLAEDRELFDTIGGNAVLFIHENFNNLAIAEKLAEFYTKHLGWH